MFFYSTWGVRIMIIDKYVPILSNISGFSPCDNRKSPTSKWAVRNTQDFLRRLVTARRDRWRLCSSDDQVCVYARDARTQWRATTRLSAKLRVVNALLCGNGSRRNLRLYILKVYQSLIKTSQIFPISILSVSTKLMIPVYLEKSDECPIHENISLHETCTHTQS